MTYLMNTLKFVDRNFVSGEGSWLIDDLGVRCLDFYADVGTASLGYNSPQHDEVLLKIMQDKIPVHTPMVFKNVTREAAAADLCNLTGMERVFFCNSGAEAVEAAIKCARLTQYKAGRPNRVDVYGVNNGFHGRTLATLALGDGPEYHHTGFGPLPSGFKHFDPRSDLRRQIRPDAAAVCIAPVFGNNDVQLYSDKGMATLKSYCEDNGILLIFDEVQSGSGRTGFSATYAQRIGIRPDIITLGKGVAMGASCGAMLAHSAAAEAFTPGSHFSTFGGQPLAASFVSGMVKYLTKENMHDIETKGNYLQRALWERCKWAANVRGVGMLVAFDLLGVNKLEFAAHALNRNLLLGLFRSGPGPVKITPPLNTTREEIDWGIERLNEAYNDCKR